MSVWGSTAIASCTNRPMPFRGSMSGASKAGTSQHHPWVLSMPLAVSSSVSSHVIHEPQGVVPPAQFVSVPAMLAHDFLSSPVSRSTSRLVVPPAPLESYVIDAGPKDEPAFRISWLRTRTTLFP